MIKRANYANLASLIKKDSLLLNIAPHVIVWGILFLFPLLFTTGEGPRNTVIYIKNWLPLFFSALIFYVNYFYLIDKLLFKKRILLFIAVNILLILALVPLMEMFFELLPGRLYSRGFRHWRIPFFFRAGFSFLLTSGISVAVRSTQLWLKTEADRKNRENENLKSELDSLRYQLQPHFFFNSLNNIYSLVDISPERAKQSIHGLSKLMRYLLYESNVEKVSLANEVAFLKSYISIMQLRVGKNVHIDHSFPDPVPQLVVAPLLFIPLAENAFKHGVSSGLPSFIQIHMKVIGKKIHFTVENSNFPKRTVDKTGSGIGLENLKKRLDLIYQGKYSYNTEANQNVFASSLIIEP